jgi:hypothetical protein
MVDRHPPGWLLVLGLEVGQRVRHDQLADPRGRSKAAPDLERDVRDRLGVAVREMVN